MSSPALAILLPPSEGKAPGGRAPSWSPGSGAFGRRLGPSRCAVLEELVATDGGDARLLGVSGSLLQRARSANLALIGAPTLAAHERYTGVVWDHLDVPTLSTRARSRAGGSVVVFSGLLGLVALEDRIPDYKLKMGASLPGLGKLSTWWKPTLSKVLDSWLSEGTPRRRIVIDLLPQEHRAAWLPAGTLGSRHVTVNFVNDSGRTIGHDAKAAKGLLVRHLLESTDPPLQALDSWRHPRFKIDVT